MSTLITPPAADAPAAVYPLPKRSRSRRERFFQHVSQPGFTIGLVMLWVALSPSLLPRTWWMHAVAVGLSVFVGYVVGELVGRLASWAARAIGLEIRVSARAGWGLRWVWDVLLILVSIAVWWWSVRQQRANADLVGLESGGNASMAVGVLAGLGLAILLLALVRGVILLWRGMRHLARRLLPQVVASVLATVLLVVGLVWVTNGVIYRRAMESALGSAAQLNAQVPAGREQPMEPERSGSPQSHQPWETLGRDGMAMVADGPRAADIERVTGLSAIEPIRLYAGKQDNESVEEAAEAVLAEMARTDAFDRSVVHVTTATGTGFVQGWSVASVEYLTRGDVATVSMQYSYFSSALAYATDRTTPVQAGKALFDAVYAEWSALPEDDRPMLVVSGESLGSYGGQGAFDSLDEMLSKVDGAVWSGTPRFTPLWSELTEDRRAGSPEIAPVVDNGRHVRFVTRPEELNHDVYGAPYVAWETPRVVYAQHASDPIVWWEPEMLWAEPDWMRERAGRDVPGALRWIPWVSFWQFGVDMPLSVSTPGGHGHHYFEEMTPYWAAVLGQDPTDTDRLRPIQAALTADFRPR
ncbi:alpha/beta hydrolase [Ornithinimicrobium sp. Y1694]|uniref:alpha/beta hydrolase n=1 Tax=Ornithinimicrobium sp. Y1694 TaxID=3418590 RepID=UPI003CEFBDBA